MSCIMRAHDARTYDAEVIIDARMPRLHAAAWRAFIYAICAAVMPRDMRRAHAYALMLPRERLSFATTH